MHAVYSCHYSEHLANCMIWFCARPGHATVLPVTRAHWPCHSISLLAGCTCWHMLAAVAFSILLSSLCQAYLEIQRNLHVLQNATAKAPLRLHYCKPRTVRFLSRIPWPEVQNGTTRTSSVCGLMLMAAKRYGARISLLRTALAGSWAAGIYVKRSRDTRPPSSGTWQPHITHDSHNFTGAHPRSHKAGVAGTETSDRPNSISQNTTLAARPPKITRRVTAHTTRGDASGRIQW